MPATYRSCSHCAPAIITYLSRIRNGFVRVQSITGVRCDSLEIEREPSFLAPVIDIQIFASAYKTRYGNALLKALRLIAVETGRITPPYWYERSNF